MNDIKLSIIIPVYNGERYLKACLESIYKDYENIAFKFETLIIDDGSKDNSSIIYNEFVNKYSNIKCFCNSNHGVSYTRNYGISKSIGKYLLFVDCDDLLIDKWHEQLRLEDDFDYIYMSQHFLKDISENEELGKVISYITTYNDENIRISGPYSKLFKNSFIKDNHIEFDEKIINGEDLLFSLEATVKAKKYLLEKKSIYIVRHNKFSATSNFNSNLIQSEINFNNRVKEILEPYGLYSEFIEKYAFLTSIRAIALRLGSLKKMKVSRKYFNIVMNNSFYKNGLKKYKYDDNIKKYIFFILFKFKLHSIAYLLGSYYNNKNNCDSMEYL